MKVHSISRLAAGMLLLLSGAALASDYVIDTKGAHAFVQFHIKHLGYSWLTGRFNTFSGRFSTTRRTRMQQGSRSRSTLPVSTPTMPSATSICAMTTCSM